MIDMPKLRETIAAVPGDEAIVSKTWLQEIERELARGYEAQRALRMQGAIASIGAPA